MAEPSRVTILCVDDEAEFRAVIRKTLVGAGFDVIESARGEDALGKAAARPDLIILDVNLPGRLPDQAREGP